MTSASAQRPAVPAGRGERILGKIDHGRPGPTFLAQGAMHGNEPAGIAALRRVLTQIEARQLEVHGRIVACVGNLQAVRLGKRFLERDLNRQWLPQSVQRLLSRSPALDTGEDGEQRALLQLYDELDATRGEQALVFLDLHTSSADGPPFTCMADTIPNRRIADALPVPMILGLEECIDGAVMEWFNQRQQIGVAVEGGRHDAPETVDNLEAAVWLALCAAGVLRQVDVDLDAHRSRLRSAARGAPHLVEILYRHAITPADRYRMAAGFVSFAPVRRGAHLGDDIRGEVRAPHRGLVLLPLYQGQGEDGFFLGRRVARFWFELSAWLRGARLWPLLRALPGVRRDPDDRDTLLVDTRIARFLVVQVFHLFGFRRQRPRGSKLLAFTRRRAAPETQRVRPRR
ncbi:MAG: succinylglutamate desuccinylase/aspartoacylase family protein [Planctomycetes bacterium]|nr:succinylglutamate desuccinylase/aspartoacylase family protein [Planctomycetota bacterium]